MLHSPSQLLSSSVPSLLVIPFNLFTGTRCWSARKSSRKPDKSIFRGLLTPTAAASQKDPAPSGALHPSSLRRRDLATADVNGHPSRVAVDLRAGPSPCFWDTGRATPHSQEPLSEARLFLQSRIH